MERKLGEIQVGEKKITTVAFEAIRTENPECSGRSDFHSISNQGNSNFLCSRGPITFTKIRINEGQGFLDNGTFVAPLDGIYQFKVEVTIYRRDAKMSMKTTRSNQTFGINVTSGTITRTATLKMKKGNKHHL